MGEARGEGFDIPGLQRIGHRHQPRGIATGPGDGDRRTKEDGFPFEMTMRNLGEADTQRTR